MPAFWMHGLFRVSLPSISRIGLLYGATIFLGAFLLFQIQPIVARFLLPAFGGSVAVWGTSLAFFTTALFLGYAYVYLLSFLRIKAQILVHGILIVCGIAALAVMPVFDASSYQHLPWAFDAAVAPAVRVLLSLMIAIGVPYFIIATTSPLLQQWYAGTVGKEPYGLYALSNLGSFLALGLYPFVIEPLWGLVMQQSIWVGSYVFLMLLIAAVGLTAYRMPTVAAAHAEAAEGIPLKRLPLWLCLAALPAAMLVSTTARITQMVVPIPFFWVLPLGLYLLSFVLAFRGWGGGGLASAMTAIAGFVTFAYLDTGSHTASIQILASLVLLFAGSLYCHALLYRTRPHAQQSSVFYLWVSFGGAVGTLLMSIGAPLASNNLSEFVLGVIVLILLGVSTYPARTYLLPAYHVRARILKICIVCAFLVLVLYGAYQRQDPAVYRERNFYGMVALYDYDGMRELYHGMTLHGAQMAAEEDRLKPTTYYTETSGVGRAVLYARDKANGKPISVGVVGLGTGSMAGWCADGDTFVFYEIDPKIIDIAQISFTYLSACEGSEIRSGDGRLLITAEREAGAPGYDVLAIDAFSDDTVPVHLLTKEAIALFMDRLKGPDSILAIHTSSRYLTLDPVMTRIADELGLASIVVNDYSEGNPLQTPSVWVLASRNAEIFDNPLFPQDQVRLVPEAGTPLWTDDYSEMFSVVKLPALISRPRGEEE